MVLPRAPADQQAQEAARDAAHEVAAAGMMNMEEKKKRNLPRFFVFPLEKK